MTRSKKVAAQSNPALPGIADAGVPVMGGLGTEIEVDNETPFSGYVIAVGASAGGLDALERLFGSLPIDSGAAFVVIQHLSPDHKSMMDNLLARYTRMPVRVAEHDMALEADKVFLIPPGKYMTLMGDRLRLAPKPEHGLSLPIDAFFHSASEQFQERAIVVVLSGTGSDGAHGLASVNEGGGFVFVQEPGSAKFDGMPRSAISTGLVDVVAPPEELAKRLAEHVRAPGAAPGLIGKDEDPENAEPALPPLEAVFDRLLATTGINFREYKRATLLRRIERRMQVLQCLSLTDYVERLAATIDEQRLLRRELLIPVTRFFRDTDAFETLATDVIADIVTNHTGNEPIRVWVACTSTGEEAYSIAILFAEAFAKAQRRPSIKIFATDVEQHYLDQAGMGAYPETIAADVSRERLQEFFIREGGSYVIRPEIRQTVIFARHNLINDPPFTRMDLVTCRNALIYFQPQAQDRSMRRLQYALSTGGYLFLGSSETLGNLQRDFASVSAKQKIYRLVRKERLSISFDAATLRTQSLSRLASHPQPGLSVPDFDASPVEAGLRNLMQSYAPLTLLVGENRELLHVYGEPNGVLQIPEGQASWDVLKLLPRDIAWAAGVLLQAVVKERKLYRSAQLRCESPSGEMMVHLVVRPLTSKAGKDHPSLNLLSFETAQRNTNVAGGSDEASPASYSVEQQSRIETLERELSATHDSLQATIEELETSNEELQATNEELMASNEELQSTNEELQSVNEELYTVNSEYQEKVDILNSVNADLENVSKAGGIPTLFVDDSLRLTRLTPEVAMLFKIREGDVGRSIEDFAHTLDYPELFADLRRTLETGIVTERETRGRDGEWWQARIQPYTERAHRARRAVMTFFNITSVKDSQRLQAVIDSLPEHLAVVNSLGTITLVNRAWRHFAMQNGDDGLRATGPGSNYLRVCAEAALKDDDARSAHEGLAKVLSGKTPHFTMQYPCHSATENRWFLMHVAPVAHVSGGAVISHVNITDWVRTPLSDFASQAADKAAKAQEGETL